MVYSTSSRSERNSENGVSLKRTTNQRLQLPWKFTETKTMQSLPRVIHACAKILCRISFTATLVLRYSTYVDQHPSLMKSSNENMPKQNEHSKTFLVAKRLLNIKLMSYPYIRSMSM